MYDGSLKKEKRRRMTFFPLAGPDLLVSLLLLRVWKSKKESVVDPEAHSCGPHIVCHKDGLCMAGTLYRHCSQFRHNSQMQQAAPTSRLSHIWQKDEIMQSGNLELEPMGMY